METPDAVTMDIVARCMASGVSLRFLNDTSPDTLDTLYAYAYQRHAEGEIAEAQRLFYLLVLYDQLNVDYLLALGLCHQRLGEHEVALTYFSRAGMLQVTNPWPSYHAAVSYQRLGEWEWARKAARASLRWCGAREPYQALAASVRAFVIQLANDNKG